MAAPAEVLIAGSGIGGLTLAIALQRRGVRTIIVERAPHLEEIGAGLQLSPNASRILDELGLGRELDEAGVRPDAVRLIDGRSGKPIAHVPLGAEAERRWGAPYRLLHRADLQRILTRAAKASGAEIRLGTEFVDFAESNDRVIVHVRAEGRDDTLAAAAVIGADGVHSAVRTRLGGAPARASGQIAWRATLPLDTRPETGVWLGPGAHLVTYPVDQAGMLNLVAVTRGKPSGGGPNTAFAGWAAPVQRLLQAAEWSPWLLFDLPPAQHWGQGLATLLGDAAHPIPPHLAQGAAMAIEDAAVLAARIAAESSAIADAMRAYEAQRMPRTKSVQKAAQRNGHVFQMGGISAKARDAALTLMGPRRLMAGFDWIYGYRST